LLKDQKIRKMDVRCKLLLIEYMMNLLKIILMKL